jgi:beta-phosphoglucomutase-like phosphatase (HAD superfamily)
MMPEHFTPFSAAIFDRDGVVTDTAGTHARACQELFDAVIPELAHGAVPSFEPDVECRRLVTGRGREDGIRAVLTGRALTVPEGRPTHPTNRRCTAGPLEGENLRQVGPPRRRAGLSVQRRAPASTTRQRFAHLLGHGQPRQFCGVVRRRASLTSLTLSVPPAECVVVDDAVIGIQAARQGGFGLIIGVDRTGKGTIS